MKSVALSLLLLLLSLLLDAPVRGESLELFKASTAGADAWVWGDARIKDQDGLLVVTEESNSENYGDVFVSDRFPFLPRATVQLDVVDVPKGNYTFQVLGFKGQEHVATADLAKSSTESGLRTFTLDELGLPPDVEQIGFKVWVGGVEGATTRIKELSYIADLAHTRVLLDERSENLKTWENESLVLSTDPLGRTVLGLGSDSAYGSILNRQAVDQHDHLILLLGLADVQDGSVSAQLVLFGPDGAYQDSVDAIQHAGAGWHSASLDPLFQTQSASSFRVKLWVGGGASTRIRLNRLLVLQVEP